VSLSNNVLSVQRSLQTKGESGPFHLVDLRLLCENWPMGVASNRPRSSADQITNTDEVTI
jgi:hypothetical protein